MAVKCCFLQIPRFLWQCHLKPIVRMKSISVCRIYVIGMSAVGCREQQRKNIEYCLPILVVLVSDEMVAATMDYCIDIKRNMHEVFSVGTQSTLLVQNAHRLCILLQILYFNNIPTWFAINLQANFTSKFYRQNQNKKKTSLRTHTDSMNDANEMTLYAKLFNSSTLLCRSVITGVVFTIESYGKYVIQKPLCQFILLNASSKNDTILSFM